MKMQKLLSSIVTIFIGVVLFAPASLAAVFGVSPPWIEGANMKPGDSYVYQIDLTGSELPGEMIIKTEIQGAPELSEWLTVQRADSLRLSKGKSTIPMSVLVNIPENALTGRYQGNIKVALSPVTANQSNVAILLGNNITVDLNVVDYDVMDYEVQKSSTTPIIEGKPVEVNLSIRNLGNTTIDDLMVDLAVVERRTNEQVASYSGEMKLFSPVRPHILGDTKISLPAPDLKAGEYWVNLGLLKDGVRVHENRLYLKVESNEVKNNLQTAVSVTQEAQPQARYAAPADKPMFGSDSRVQTSVEVRAPIAEELIIVVIGILLVLTGILGKFYLTFKKRKR